MNLFPIIDFEMLFSLIFYREHAPSIIFMDEIDSIGSSRLEGGSGGKIWLFVCLFVCFYLFTKCYLLVITYISGKRYCSCNS